MALGFLQKKYIQVCSARGLEAGLTGWTACEYQGKN